MGGWRGVNKVISSCGVCWSSFRYSIKLILSGVIVFFIISMDKLLFHYEELQLCQCKVFFLLCLTSCILIITIRPLLSVFQLFNHVFRCGSTQTNGILPARAQVYSSESNRFMARADHLSRCRWARGPALCSQTPSLTPN